MNTLDKGEIPAVSGNILVVDDTPANLRLLSGMLTEQGYKVRSAPNGKLALMGAKAAPPDLILLDINMLDLNGYEVCEQLKTDPRTQDIPVIFISALDQTEDKVKAFTLGGVDYITKPFQIEEVLARVHTHLSLHRLQQELEAANQDLRATNEELAASNADLDAFAHTVAHDLKNPLSAIIGFSSLLETRFTRMEPDKVTENLQRISRTGYKMRDIIEGLLLLAKVRQTDDIAITPLDMDKIVNDALARFTAQIEETGADIVLPESWPAIVGYAPWVEEVWANYIGNALKYGGDAEAGVAPRVEVGSHRMENGEWRMENQEQSVLDSEILDSFVFYVRDNGPGLSPEEQAQVFTPFTRFHKEKAEGHGLGLSIVKRIVEKLGGDVGVKCSGIGEGCAFWFTLNT